MRHTITNHGQNVYSVTFWQDGRLVRQVANLHSMAECRAEIATARERANGQAMLDGLTPNPDAATAQQQRLL